MGSYVLSRFGLKKNGDNVFLSPEDVYKLQELYPFAGILDLHLNRINYAEYGDVSMSGLSGLISRTDNPGLAFVASVSGESYKKEEELYEKDLLKNKLEELSNPESLFLRKKYKLEVVENTMGSEYVKRRKYLFEEIKRRHKLYHFKKKWKVDKRTENLEQTEKIGLNKSVASEKLAEIYLKQGLKDKAIEMYNQLILDNPKKSDYFAQILKKIN